MLLKFVTFFCVSISFAMNLFGASLIGGRLASPDEFPEVIRIRSENSYCSASLIGPRVVLTAGHCSHGESGEIIPVSEDEVYHFEVNESSYTAKCTVAPEYYGREGDQDMALCLADKEVNVKYGIISKESPKLGETLILSGYGGTVEGGGGYDGKLRVGEAPVIKLPSENYFSIHTKGQSALNFGDSGGPAFKFMRDPFTEDHYIYSVNSRGNIVDLSLLTAVFHPRSLFFMRKFEVEKGVKICGLSKSCKRNQDEQNQGCDKITTNDKTKKNH